jgi:hypothetical protein
MPLHGSNSLQALQNPKRLESALEGTAVQVNTELDRARNWRNLEL